MNRYPLHPRPQRWEARLNPTVIRLFRALRRRKAAREQRLVEVDVRGADLAREAVERGAGVLITPNHPGHADAYAMFEAADTAGVPFYYMSAWQVFEMHGAIGRWLLTRHGCFSVDREGADKDAFRAAVEVVREKREPLVVFPEGEVYHQNDRVTPFRDGAAAIALSAARKAPRPIVAIPCAIKYAYLEDPKPALVELMGRLEKKVLWRPRPDLPLAQRVYRLAEALLALKEIEYLGETMQGTIAARRLVLADHILSGIEGRHGVRRVEAPANASAIPVRVKEARAACLKRLAEIEEGESRAGESERLQIAADLDDLFLVVQAFSYPGDYVDERPSVERLAETLDKFEEDVLGAATATVRARRRAVVQFGEAIEVGGGEQPAGQAAGGGGRMTAGELTARLERRVQELLDGMG